MLTSSMSAFGGKADIPDRLRRCPLMTQSGHMPGGLPRAGPSLITAEEFFQGTNRTTLEMWKLVGL